VRAAGDARLPLSRLSTPDNIVREAQRAGIAARISDKTVWRWLHEDTIRPLATLHLRARRPWAYFAALDVQRASLVRLSACRSRPAS
jgi:hypothetical protein